MAGQSVACPACGTALQVPGSTDIKFHCSDPDCGQNIVVDVSEAGRFIRCPACGKPQQIPGSPPKSMVPVQPANKRTKPGFVSTQKEAASLSPLKRLWYGWGMGAALIGVLTGGLYVRSWAIMPRHMGTMLDEIFSDGRILDAPVANHAGSALLYAQELQKGVGVFLEDLTTLKRTQIQGMDTVEIEGKKSFRLFGWSPEDRYLAFVAVTVVTNQANKKHQEIVLCDGATGAIKSSLDMNSSVPRPELGVWLTTNSLILLNHSHRLMLFNLETDRNLGPSGTKGLVQSLRLDNSGSYGLVRVSNRSIAYVDRGNVWTLDIPTGRVNQLTHFSDATLEWLDYSPKTGRYLFCATHGDDITNRYVYEFIPNGTMEPIQLTDTYSLKGQWLKDGAGIACIRTEGDKSYLAIESDNKTICTNLFAGGSIRSYGLSPERDTIYAVASFRYRSQSIWEYNIFNKSSRDVLPEEERTVSASKIILPVTASTVNKDGKAVQYYFVPPAQLISKKKYPAVLDLYPVNRYDQNVQILANAGIFYFSASRFGLNDWQLVAKPEDILAVYNELLKNPNVDPKRIYICGRSFSTGAVTAMVDGYPDLWHGVILFSPVAFPEIPVTATQYPSLFIAVGDEDDLSLQERCNRLWQNACRRLIPARIRFEHAEHGFKTANYKTSYAALTTFIQSDY